MQLDRRQAGHKERNARCRGTTHIGATLLALVLLGPVQALAQNNAEVFTYTLRPRIETGVLEVELRWETRGRTSSRLCISPRYGSVANVPALLRDLTFDGAAEVRPEGACWQIQHRPGAELRVRYTVDPGTRTLEWDNTHAPVTTRHFFHGIGNTFMLAPPPGWGHPHEFEFLVVWDIPRDWRAACSWGYGRTIGGRISADELRHAVYLAGELVTHTLPVEGARELRVVMVDAFAFDAEAFATRAAQIVQDQVAFMGDARFPHYVVTVVPVGPPLAAGNARLAGAGLDQGFALWLAPRSPLGPPVDHLFAHELFHHWNGRVLRAAHPGGEGALAWFLEGFTEYYALRLLRAEQRWDNATFAEWINRHVRAYADNPARNASNDEIAARFWSDRQTYGEAAYQRGVMLGLRWHQLARERGRPEGVDAWLRALLAKAGDGVLELSNELLRTEGERALGAWFGAEFDRYVVQVADVEVPSDALEPWLTGRVGPVYAFELGFNRQESLATQRVTGLLPGSAAERSGLRDGDELVGWNLHNNPDERIQLQVRRGAQVRTIRYLPRGESRDLLQFRPRD